MADSRRYNGYDNRDPYGQGSTQSGQRGSSRMPSSSQPAQRRGSYDDVERYPSGRPKTQRQPSGSAYDARSAGYADGSRGGYPQGGAPYTHGSSHGYDPSVPSYRRGTGEYRQAGNSYDQGGYTAHAGTSYGAHSRADQRGGYTDDARYQDSHGRAYRDHEGRPVPPSSHTGATGHAAGGQGRAQYPRGSHAAAADALPEPLARLADTARANPTLVIAMAVGIVVVAVALVFAACSALSHDGSYVQAVDATQGSSTNTLSATPSATPTSSQSSTSGDAATGDAATTDGTGAAADAQATDASAQQEQAPAEQSAVAQLLTPAWPDDVSNVSDIFTFATTSFDKDATYNNGGVEDPWSPTGYFTTGDAELDQMVKDYCDSNAQDGLDAGDNAYYTYLHISWIDYVESDRNQRPWDLPGDWRITYAKQCFSTMSANCHEFAAAVQYILRYYGYADACAETCLVLRQSGNWGDHSLVFVTSLDGRASIIDTSMSSKGWLLSKDSMTYTLDSGYRADLAASEDEAADAGEQAAEGDQAASNG